MHREPNFSGILGETAAIVAEAIVYILGLVVVLAGLNTAGQIGGAVDPERLWGFGFMFESGTTLWGLAAAVLALVVQFVGCYFVLARMLELRGRLVAEGTRLWAYVGLSILTGLGTLLGFVALIVPGVVLLVRWSAAPGFLIGHGTGVIEAMGKSWEATRANSWSIFFAGVVLFAALLFAAAAVGGFSTPDAMDSVAEIAIGSLVEAITTAISLAFSAAVFVLVDEGAEEIEQVFA